MRNALDTSVHTADARQLKVVQVYVSIAWLYLLVFIPLYVIVIKNPLLYFVHFVDLAIVIWVQWSFRSNPKTEQITLALAIIAAITVGAVMVTGGVKQSGPFLVFPYIPFIVFMRSEDSARRWMFGMLLYMIGLIALSEVGTIRLPIGQATFALYIFMYLLTIMLTLAYVREKNISDNLLAENAHERARINHELSLATKSQKQAFDELSLRNQQLEKINIAMVGRELKMIELKKQLRAVKLIKDTERKNRDKQ